MTIPEHPERREIPGVCSEIGPDDGTDPRDWNKHANVRPTGRKALQLCRQVREALDAAFADCGDDVLNSLTVVSVAPAPHAGRLLVTVAATGLSDGAILDRLVAAAGHLRTEIAAAITRRKVPELAFQTSRPL